MIVKYGNMIEQLDTLKPGTGFLTCENHIPYLLLDDTKVMDLFHPEYWTQQPRADGTGRAFLLGCSLLDGELKIFPGNLKVRKLQLECSVIS